MLSTDEETYRMMPRGESRTETRERNKKDNETENIRWAARPVTYERKSKSKHRTARLTKVPGTGKTVTPFMAQRSRNERCGPTR